MAMAVAGDTDNETYRPLNGRALVDMARERVHHGDGRYLNPFSVVKKGSIWPVLRWKLFSTNTFAEHYDGEALRKVQMDWQRVARHHGVSVTFMRHATVLIQDGTTRFLVDPVFGPIFSFIKDFSPLTGDSLDHMPPPTRVLITHGHYDHLDIDSLRRLGPDTRVISPLGYEAEFAEAGITRRTPLDWFDDVTVEGNRITLLPCNHWTMRNPFVGPNTGLWGSYLIETRQGATIYVCGDTGYFDGFEQIGAMADIDLAVINMGAYEPRWFMASSHMNPAETVKAFAALGARRLMITHWGTFRLGDEPVHFPPQDIQQAMAAAGMGDRLLSVSHGDTITL